jgi:predicted phage terminase large subunit-like protein
VGSRRYLLHVTNAHLDLVGTMNEIRNAHATYGPVSAVLVESAANGVSVIAHLKEEIAGLVPITAKDSKMARLVAASPEFQAQNWIIERNGPWAHKVVEQLTMFPNCKNDDISDSISQASIWLQANTYELGLLDYMKSLFLGKRKMPASVEQHLAATVEVDESKSSIVTEDHWKAWVEKHQTPPCPNPTCKNICTFLQRDHEGEWHLHCRQCGRVDGKEIVKPIDGNLCWVPGCGLELMMSGGVLRCQNHGQVPTVNNPSIRSEPTNGMSRKEYFRRRGQFVLRDGPTKFPWSSSGRF